jgi:hypothetical protein
VIEVERALCAAAAELLEANGEVDLADLLRSAALEVVGRPEAWTVGTRAVAAYRIALGVDAAAYADLRAAPARLEAVRAALAAAVRGPGTDLAELVLVLRLPGVAGGLERPLAAATARLDPERPAAAAVLAGAVELLEAEGRFDAAALVEVGALEAADVPSAGEGRLVRYVARLPAEALVEARRRPDLEGAIAAAVRDAATRAAERVASVELALLLRDGAPDAFD